ncbi:Chaperone protein DnaJ [compost metagenome]
MANFYEILGVAPNATTETIRRAFRDRAKERHPDTVAGSEAAMVRLNQAYETLKDARRRREYDASLAPAFSPFEAPFGAPTRPRRPQARPARAAGSDPLLFLLQVFHPLDHKLAQALVDLKAALEEVAYDIYDDTYVSRFEKAVLQTERIITGLDGLLQRADWPAPLMNALNLYSQAVRQVEDALGDFRDFSQSYDVDLIVQGIAILDAASELLDEARDGLELR